MKHEPKPSRRNLVFTSAGDNANLQMWLAGQRDFDLWVTYYGDHIGRYQEMADYYQDRKGGKFPNLHAAYHAHSQLFEEYDFVMVMDDDIIIDTKRLNHLFEIARRYDLWLTQPAFKGGKISHEITVKRPGVFITYTNFVEMNVPLFSRYALKTYMSVYDPRLVGWGNDWWFLDVLGPDLEGRVAVVDGINCINPFDSLKRNGIREIDVLQSRDERIRIWEEIKRQYGITSESRGQQEYRRVPMTNWQKVTDATGQLKHFFCARNK